MGVTSNIISKFSGASKSTIIAKLEGTRVSLEDGVANAQMRAASLSDQIADLHVSAANDKKQAAAIAEALTILNNAGVEV